MGQNDHFLPLCEMRAHGIFCARQASQYRLTSYLYVYLQYMTIYLKLETKTKKKMFFHQQFEKKLNF